MLNKETSTFTRRDFLKVGGLVAAGAALNAACVPITVESPLPPQPTSTPDKEMGLGYFEAKVDTRKPTIRKAIEKAYRESLLADGSDPTEARELEDNWQNLCWGMNIVVVNNINKALLIFTSAKALENFEIADSDEYMGSRVLISVDPNKGSEGLSLADVVKDFVLNHNFSYSAYDWTGDPNINNFRTGEVIPVEDNPYTKFYNIYGLPNPSNP